MVLVLALERPPAPQKKEPGKPPQYRLLQYKDGVAVVYSAAGERPTDEEVEAALAVASPNNVTEAAGFFVTPYDVLVENTPEGAPKVTMDTLLAAINKSVGRRENTTIVNRGPGSSEQLERTLLSVVETVKASAESAMQMVADEIAKDKQMQRLLQLENDGGLDDDRREGAKSGPPMDGAGDEYAIRKDRSLPISAKLKEQLMRLHKDYPYAGAAQAAGPAAPLPGKGHGGGGSTRPHADATRGNPRRQQFTLLSAASGEDLVPPCTAGSTLVPLSFMANPPAHRAGRGAAASVVRERNSRSRSYQFALQKRKSTMGLLSELMDDSTPKESVEPLKGNGWGEEITSYYFDGGSSVMAVPGVPRFEELIKCFSVDFWLRTDCKAAEGKRTLIQIADSQREDMGQLFQLGLNWYEDMEESLRVFVRDSANRVLEALIPVRAAGVCSSGKEFHHIMLHVRSLDEGTLECVIDGVPVAVQLLQQEHPIAFNPWPHRLFIGGCLDQSNNSCTVLRGTIMELRFWTGGKAGSKPVVRWPLLAEESGKLSELTRTIPADHHETLLNLHGVVEKAPHSAPHFDGSLVMNAGTLPLWGELMDNWRLEIRFRTDVSTRMMSLIGVTDQKFKMQEVGIVLNAEPVFSKERFRFHEFNVAFYLVDAFGACCSALMRGTERQSVVDGEWHTLVWKCVDSETNKFTVKVDGVRQELLYVAREGPSKFVEMDDWVCVGGHNVRNWKVKRPFEGYVSRFCVTLRGHHYATVEMNEGPGAHVVQDRSGHGNHGLLINPETNVVRRNDITWIPSRDEPDEAVENGGVREDVIVYKNNNVAVAAVIFTCVFDEVGTPHEAIYDIYQKQHFAPQPTPHAYFEAKPMWGTWQALPKECFKPLETLNQLEESINQVLKTRKTTPRGHLMVIIRIGDSHSTLLHLQEPEMPPEAVFSTNMLKWQYPFTIEGVVGRRELMLNRMIEGLDGVLLNATLKPFIAARLGPLHKLSDGAPLLCEEVVRSLQSCGMPWFLPSIVHSLLLHTEYGSNLHIIHRCTPTMSYDQGASLCLFNRRLYEGAKDKAAIVIQRNWKVVMARAEAVKRQEVKQLRDRKVEEIRTLRTNPAVQKRDGLVALLVTLHATACDKIPVIQDEANVNELEELLKQQGYAVERLSNPSASALMKAIAQVNSARSSFVYISGFGGQMNIRQPPILSLQAMHLSLQEGAIRAGLEAEAGSTFRSLWAQYQAETAEVASRKKKKKKSTAGKSAPAASKKLSPAEQEMQERQLQAVFRAAQMDVEQEEAFLRDAWSQEYEAEVQAISREIRQTVVAAREFERRYKSSTISGSRARESIALSHDGHGAGEAGDNRNTLFPCECKLIEPYASAVIDVEDLIRTALHRQMPVTGLQSVIAIDLEPQVAYGKGFACLASSTGNTLRMPYQPEQRRLLSEVLCSAFVGDFPATPATSKYAVLTGGIVTAEGERDWKSFASYVIHEMRSALTPERLRALYRELDREMPFTAELVPIRRTALSAEAKDRRVRDKEAQKVNVSVSIGVGSNRVQSDMFGLFKNILEGLPLSEIAFTNTVNIVFTQSNKGIDGILLGHLAAEVEKCRPADCTMHFSCRPTGNGAVVAFETSDPSHKLAVTQWLNGIVVRSLSWQIARNPIEGYRKLDVDYVEYVYAIKTTCSLRRYEALVHQRCASPIPEPYIRFLNVEVVKGK